MASSSQRSDTVAASQPGKRTVRRGPLGVGVREMGREPRAERRVRSASVRERVLSAWAKSVESVGRRFSVLRVC